MRERLIGALRGRLARNTGWMLAGQGLRTVIQAVYFIFIARALGVSQYGSFVGVAALAAMLAPFATWGAGNVLVRHVARDATVFRPYWGAALRATIISACALGVVILAVAGFVLPGTIPLLLVLEIACADLFFARIVDLSGQAFQGVHDLGRTAATQLGLGGLRLVAAAALYGISGSRATVNEWGALYLGATAMAALLSMLWVNSQLGAPDRSGRLTRREIADGFHFSVSNSAASVYNDIDKTMLAKLATLEATGAYGAAYRILDVSFVPIRSLLSATYASFFKAGASGIRGSLALARRLLPLGLGYGVVASLALYLCAPLVPRVLGAEYATCVTVIRLLCVLPLLRSLHYFAADTLTGADRQAVRSSIQASIAIGNVFLNLWLLPLYSWRGAVWSTLVCDGALVVSLWGAVAVLAYQWTPMASSAGEPIPAESTAQ